jgi:hypothetical protein
MVMTSAQAAQRGRLGAHRLYATHDAREIARKARAGLVQKFEREVDPEMQLDPQERARRAEHARRAYFQSLALKSAAARRAR